MLLTAGAPARAQGTNDALLPAASHPARQGLDYGRRIRRAASGRWRHAAGGAAAGQGLGSHSGSSGARAAGNPRHCRTACHPRTGARDSGRQAVRRCGEEDVGEQAGREVRHARLHAVPLQRSRAGQRAGSRDSGRSLGQSNRIVHHPPPPLCAQRPIDHLALYAQADFNGSPGEAISRSRCGICTATSTWTRRRPGVCASANRRSRTASSTCSRARNPGAVRTARRD